MGLTSFCVQYSIGSLGKFGLSETVEYIHVKDAQFTGTTNGVRIKTWQVLSMEAINDVTIGSQPYRYISPILNLKVLIVLKYIYIFKNSYLYNIIYIYTISLLCFMKF